MNIFITGINYKTAPVDVREVLSFNSAQLDNALHEIRNIPGVKECVILSTCNRTEVYVYSGEYAICRDVLESFICSIKDADVFTFKKHFYRYEGSRAVKHLFKVACGLDSQVLGEDQILGQVKSAHELSLDKGSSGVVLNTLFREAVTAAKKIKTDTGLSRNSISIGSIAVKLLERIFGNELSQKTVTVIGAGKISTIALKNLIERKVKDLYITNRTHGKALDLTKLCEGINVVEYQNRYKQIAMSDIVISSTSSPHYTVTEDMLKKALKPGQKLLFIDLAVPRDIDDSVREIEGITLYDIDDLKVEIDSSIDKRMAEAKKAEEIVNEFIVDFERWYGFRQVLPVVKEIQRFSDEYLEEKIKTAIDRLKSTSDEDKTIVEQAMKNVVNGLLDKMVYGIRECSTREEIVVYFKCIGEVLKKINV